MGYMDLSIGGSDNASDASYCLSKVIVKELKKEEKRQDNGYNTDGVINVALILENLSRAEEVFLNEPILRYLSKFLPRLNKYMKSYDDSGDGKKRLKAIAKKLGKILEENEWLI